jgi:hypothetical protein
MRVVFAFVLAALIVWAVDQLPSGVGPDRPAAPNRATPPSTPAGTPAVRSRAASPVPVSDAWLAAGPSGPRMAPI